MEAIRNMHLPPGFGFHPSDAELISHYLKRKVHGQRIEYDLIPEVDIYKHEPWDLPSKCNLPIEDNKWHFFASRDRKYPTGGRSNRATRAGYWKSTGKDRAIKQNKRTLGTKKTLVFHEGRPPSGKRTEWIMHEYYIDENECQASPDMKDAFVLCRVTRRDDWDNDNGSGNRNPHPQHPSDAATSVVVSEKQEDPATSVVIAEKLEDTGTSVVIAEKQNTAATLGICAGEPNHVGTPAIAELSNDVAPTAFMAHSPNSERELEEWMAELLTDGPSSPVVDTGSAGLSLNEQDVESSNLQNHGFMGPKVEPGLASPIQNGIDDTQYLTQADFENMLSSFDNPIELYSMMETNNDVFPNIPEGFWNEELPALQEGLSNENVDNGIKIRRRSVSASPASSSPSTGRIRLQVGVNRMVTSNSETTHQTMRFAGKSGHMKSFKRSDDSDATRSSENNSDQGNTDAAKSSEILCNPGKLRGIKGVFTSSSARFNILFACVCMIGVIAAILHGYGRSGTRL